MLYYNEQIAVLSGNSIKLQDISIKCTQNAQARQSLKIAPLNI